MGFAFGNTYPSTSTWGQNQTTWNGTMPPFGYFQVIPPVVQRVEGLVEKLRAARHRQPRYPLPVWPETLAIPAVAFVAAVRSHRRTVVPRGTVSWIRAGTRRPL